MAIEFTGVNGSRIFDNGSSARSENISSDTKRSGNAPSRNTHSDTVTLTGIAKQMRELEKSIAEVPVVDSQRVHAVKSAIQNGTFEIDPSRVAIKLMAFEGRLFG